MAVSVSSSIRSSDVLKLGGHPQFVRPLIYPMAQGALLKEGQTELPEKDSEILKGAASASDNYANFFGQMLFPASAGVALVVGTMNEAGYNVTLSQIALWSVPVFIIALVLSAIQFALLDKKLGVINNDLLETLFRDVVYSHRIYPSCQRNQWL